VEIAPVTVSGRGGDVVIDKDEGPLKAKLDKIPALKPAFKKDGTITAASSSSINDGAAALVLMRESKAKELGLTPIAKSSLTHPCAGPGWFTTAPIGAIQKLYKKTGWTTADVDLFEINEAFAAVPMAAMKDLGISTTKLTSTVVPAHSAILSAHPAHVSSSR
jgi:acetyl-CoA C-acetyltransferase